MHVTGTLTTLALHCDAGAGAVGVAAAQQSFAEIPAAQAMLSSRNTASADASDVVYDEANEEVNAAGGYGTRFEHAQEIRWLNNHYQRIIQNERGVPTFISDQIMPHSTVLLVHGYTPYCTTLISYHLSD